MKTTTALLFLLAILALPAAAQAQDQSFRGHCTAGETVKFACKMAKGSKVLSLCASPEFSANQGYLQYRYGKLGKVEMEYPVQPVFSGNEFTISRYTRPQVTLLSVSFTVKDVTYDVYDNYVAEDGEEDVTRGVTVNLPDGRSIDLPCSATVESDLFSLDSVLPPGEQ